MLIQTPDPHHFNEKAQQIRAHVPTALTQRGLLPKFMSWRLTQDPSTGLVVLFGILNDKYIAEHTETPFDAYFDPRLLHDLATDLQVQVVSSTHEGLRYAFILDWGQLGQQTAPVDFSGLQPGPLLAEETDSHKPLILTRDEQGGVAIPTGSSSPTFAHRVVYHALADGFQQTPMSPTANFPGLRLPLPGQAVIEAEVQPPIPLFASPLRYPESLNEYMPVAMGSGLETLPRPLWAPENYNDLLRTLGRSAGEFAQAAASLAGIGRQLGLTVLISAPKWTAK